jgi:hypothetical protein
MLPAIAQAIANVLVAGTSLTSTEQIDFGHPGYDRGQKPGLTLYLYEIQETNLSHHCTQLLELHHELASPEQKPKLRWFNIVFVLIAWDHTTLGEQRLLSETLTLLLHYQTIPAEFLPPLLQKIGALPMQVAPLSLTNTNTFWNVIGIPLCPALRLTVTTPFPLAITPPGYLKTPVSDRA